MLHFSITFNFIIGDEYIHVRVRELHHFGSEMDDDFDISDPAEETSAADPLQGLDDLDDDLFGSVLKKKVNSKLSAQSSKPQPDSAAKKSNNLEPVDDDDDDEDDPLAGLLDDEDEKPNVKTNEPKAKRKSVEFKGGNVSDKQTVEVQQKKANPILDDFSVKTGQQPRKQESQRKQENDTWDVLGDMGLDDTSRSKTKQTELTKSPSKEKSIISPTKGKSFMDDLLGRKGEPTPDKPKKTEFVLGEKYKSPKQEKEDYLFGSYNPSTTSSDRGTPRRRNFGVSDGMQDNAGKKKEAKADSTPPLVKADTVALPSQRRKSSSADWLLKNDDILSPENPRRRETEIFSGKATAGKDSKPDWLGFTSNTSSDQPTKAEMDKKFPIASNDSDWLQNLQFKHKSDAKQQQTEVSTHNVKNESKLEENTKVIASEVKESVEIPSPAAPVPQQVAPVVTPQPSNPQPVVVTQLQTEMIEQVASLQTMVTKLQMEKDHLTQTLESTQNRHKTELKTAEELSRDKLHMVEEEHKELERRMKEEYTEKINSLERRIEELKDEKASMTQVHRKHAEDTEIDHRKEIQRLKELHSRAITSMKEEHEEALSRIRNLKDQEVEAVSSTQSYARTIQNLAEQLEARTAELSALQQTVEGRHESVLNERQIFLEMKEKEIKAREQRLIRQREEEDEERTRLQQLVLRLETRLQMQTKEMEESRWEFQQDKVKIEVHQKSFLAERRQFEEQLEMEKLQIKRSKDSLLQEQQRLYAEVARQRQELLEEKNRFDAQQRQWLQSESERTARKLKEEINFNAEKQFLQEEKKQLELKQQQLEKELKQLHLDRLTVERDQKAIKTEQHVTNNLTSELQKRSREIEETYRNAIREREEAMRELYKAQEIEMKNNARISELADYLEKIKMKEGELRKLKQSLEDERKLLQTNKAALLCSSCRLAVGHNLSALYMSSLPNNSNALQYSNMLMSSREDPNFLMWQVASEKDKEFLEQERLFLESLTGKPMSM